MSPLTPTEQLRRERIESVLVLAAPVLDLVLAAGDRISRAVGREDEYYPIRAPGEAFELPTPSAEPPTD
ncbi:MAG TPA: hypothetical protein VK919_02515 [Solirubrobacterales bacterium]|nr:hypothetical protein [Solirubrobacterales bacterium]